MTSNKLDYADFRAFPGRVSRKDPSVYEYPTLYSLNKLGKEQMWKVYVIVLDSTQPLTEPYARLNIKNNFFADSSSQEMYALVQSERGQIGGRITKGDPSKVTDRVNVGKKNERNVFMQALIKSRDAWLKKKSSGYVEDISILTNPDTAGVNRADNINGNLYFAMAAQTFADNTINNIQPPYYSQPKLDGVRCLICLHNEKIYKYSRRKKEYIVEALDEELAPIFNKYPDVVLDGEIYMHGKSLQDIVGIAKNNKMADKNVEYHIFDVIYPPHMEWTFSQRLMLISRIFALVGRNSSRIKRVKTTLVRALPDLDPLLEEYVKDGYEGQIVRLNAPYEATKHREIRSRSILKRKKVITTEFKFVGLEKGRNGKAEGTFLGVFETPNGVKFEAPAKNMSQKDSVTFHDSIEADIDSYIGLMGTIEHETYTKSGVPRSAKFVTFRDYE